MNLTPIALAVAGIYGMHRSHLHSAAWLWFDWTRDRQGRPVSYRWKF